MSKKVLVVAAHPDDEVLGCGGAIAKHTTAGDEVHVLLVAEGLTSRESSRDNEKLKNELDDLTAVARKANEVLGVSKFESIGLPDNRLDSLDLLDIIKPIEKKIDEFNPGVVYTHFGKDLNIDHRIVSQAVQTACRPVPGGKVRTLLQFEILSSSEWNDSGSFEPNWMVDISKQLNTKLKALEVYDSEMRDFPHARSLKAIESLAILRGSSVGVDAAEAFRLVRNIC